MTLPELLKKTVELDGSDLHLTTNTPPQVRVHGHLQRLEGADLTPAETKQLAYSVLTDAQKKRFEEHLELDFSFGLKGLARFRCNMFNQRGAVAAVYRLIPEKIRSFQELNLPPVLANLAERPRGLVLVTGPTGSGKSTTLAAMIDKINRIIDISPSHQQSQIRTQLSLVLEGIVCQALLPKIGGGRVVSLEIMIPTPAIRNLIREDKVHQIYSAMQTGQEKVGMQTMNQSLATLQQRRQVTLETAIAASSNRDELQDLINRGVGVVAGAGLNRPGIHPRQAVVR